MLSQNMASATTSVTPVKPYASVDPIGRWVVRLLIAQIVVGALRFISGMMEMGLLARANSGGVITMSEAIANDDRQQFLAGLSLLLFVPTAVLFAVWFYRAYRNLPALGVRGLSFSPRRAVGGFFIPFVNLCWIYVAVRELWRASSPEVELRDGTEWKTGRIRSVVGLWWGLYLVSNFTINLASRAGERIDDLGVLTSLSGVIAICCLALSVAAAFLVSIVKQVGQAQDDRFAEINDPPLYGSALYRQAAAPMVAHGLQAFSTGHVAPSSAAQFTVKRVPRSR